MTAIYLAMFLVALDRTIIGTAIPKITDDFHSINDVGWYASAYLITLCAFQLIYGRIYTFYTAKWVLLSAIAIFELGSVVCGAAPSSVAFIIGRAIGKLTSLNIRIVLTWRYSRLRICWDLHWLRHSYGCFYSEYISIGVGIFPRSIKSSSVNILKVSEGSRAGETLPVSRSASLVE